MALQNGEAVTVTQRAESLRSILVTKREIGGLRIRCFRIKITARGDL